MATTNTQSQDFRGERAYLTDRMADEVTDVVSIGRMERTAAIAFIEAAIRAFGATPEALEAVAKYREPTLEVPKVQTPAVAAEQVDQAFAQSVVEEAEAITKQAADGELSVDETLAAVHNIHDATEQAHINPSDTDYTLAA